MADWPIYSTVRIVGNLEDGMQSVGTGFFVQNDFGDGNKIPFLVTNKHVIKDAKDFEINIKVLTKPETDYSKSHINPIKFQAGNLWVEHPDPNVDLAAINISMFFNLCHHYGLEPVYAAFTADMVADDAFFQQLNSIENVLMVGYPNGLWDAVHNNPITRRGITATPIYNDFQGAKEFLIDCACFQGSSGSPVMLFDQGGHIDKAGVYKLGESRFKLLGILYAGHVRSFDGTISVVDIPTVSRPVPVISIPINLGTCIKATALKFFADHFHASAAAEKAQRQARGMQNP